MVQKINILALSNKLKEGTTKTNWYIDWFKTHYKKTFWLKDSDFNVIKWKTSEIYMNWKDIYVDDKTKINIDDINLFVYWWRFFNKMTESLVKYIEDNWWYVITSYGNNRLFDKFNQYLDIQNSELAKYYPKTYMIFKTNNTANNTIEDFKNQILKVSKKVWNEFVIKYSEGSDGDEVELIKNEKDLDKYLKMVKEKNLKWVFLIQEKINCKPWFDYRWYVIKDKLESLVNRVNLDWGFKSNTTKWNVITQYVDLDNQDEELKKLINLIIKHFKKDDLRYYWFDILKDEQTWKYYFIEINVIAWYMKAKDKDWNIIMDKLAEKMFSID